MTLFARLTGRVGFVVFAALLGMLAGCTTYVNQPEPRGANYSEPPRPREAYVQPPAYVPPPAIYVPPPAPEPDPSVEFAIHAESDFYEPLAAQGEWVVIGSYGRCWRPAHVARDWRPYCNGNWRRTDAGWYWVSDEPWGWATYHYGRWDFTDQYGWYWVPQTQWAPAWVSWHEGGGYVGWAPLHPSARVSIGRPVEVNVAQIAPREYVFVEQRQFLEPVRPTTVVVNNTTVINKTVNITNTKIVNNIVINEGPRTEVVEKASGRKVQAVPVRELRRKQEAEVVTRRRTAQPGREKNEKNAQTPIRTEIEPRETKVQPDAHRATKQAEAPAQAERPRSVNDAEAATQLELKRQAKEAAAQAQVEKQRNAREAARIRVESEQRSKESKQKSDGNLGTGARHERPQAEKPTPATAEPATRGARNPEAQDEQHKSALPAAESRPAMKPEARPETNHPAAIKESTRQKAGNRIEKQEQSAKPAEKKMRQPAKAKPATNEVNELNPTDKDHERKPKDKE